MASTVVEVHRKNRFEDKITINQRDLLEDEGEVRAVLESWLAANGWDRGLWDEFSIRLGRQEVRY
jgi:hypothetical protein